MDFSLFTQNPYISFGIIIYIGLVLGSFASVLIYRVPRQRSWIWEELDREDHTGLTKSGFIRGLLSRSKCPKCQNILKLQHLIPILSWITLRGKCGYCGYKIPAKYPFLELLSVSACLGIYLQFGWQVETLILVLSVPFLIALFFIDLEFLILPNHLVIILAFIALLEKILFFEGMLSFVNFIAVGLAYGFMGWALRAGFYKFTGKEGLGLGDVKFFALAGFWLGWFMTPVFLLLSTFIGVVFALYWRVVHKSNMFPYGPSLVLALFICIVYNKEFAQLFLL